jgi:hypothetical protein
MGLPAIAKVEATRNFLATFKVADKFFQLQDTDTAASRLTKLKAGLEAARG